MKTLIVLIAVLSICVVLANNYNWNRNVELPCMPYLGNSQNLDYSFIKEFEGFRSKRYVCSGKVSTIGYGHTGSKHLSEVTKKHAEKLFEQDIRKAEWIVETHVKVPITDQQKRALVSFAYNLGDKFYKLKDGSTPRFLRELNAGQYESAAKYMSKYVYAKGKKLAGLVKRRTYEKNLFEGSENA